MVMVTVRNTTDINVKIQEGNAGMFTTKATLRPQGTFPLDLDPNATYREYVLIRLPDNKPLEPMFSSDAVAKLKEIIIRQEEGGPNYCWEGIFSRDQLNSDPATQINNGHLEMDNPPANSVNHTGGRSIRSVQWLKNLFR